MTFSSHVSVGGQRFHNLSTLLNLRQWNYKRNMSRLVDLHGRSRETVWQSETANFDHEEGLVHFIAIFGQKLINLSNMHRVDRSPCIYDIKLLVRRKVGLLLGRAETGRVTKFALKQWTLRPVKCFFFSPFFFFSITDRTDVIICRNICQVLILWHWGEVLKQNNCESLLNAGFVFILQPHLISRFECIVTKLQQKNQSKKIGKIIRFWWNPLVEKRLLEKRSISCTW